MAAVAAYAIAVASVGLTFLLDVPHPLFFAVTSGLLELLPVLGPIAAALIAGGSIFGPLGLLLAIPAAVAVKVTREAVLAPAPGAADLATHREGAGRSRRS